MDFLYPLADDYPISQTYAQHIARGQANYNGGIDWACPNDTPVYAAQAGNVMFCGPDMSPGGGYGVHVRIQHAGGCMTIYGHLRTCLACVGDKVVAGQIIGRSDNSGNSSGPHLHFELRYNNNDIDPQPLLVRSLVTDDNLEPGDTLIVNASGGLNLRAKPTTASSRILLLKDKQEIEATGPKQGDWIPVKVTLEYTGWVHGDYVRQAPAE